MVLVLGQNCCKCFQSELTREEIVLHTQIDVSMTHEITAAGNLLTAEDFQDWRRGTQAKVVGHALAVETVEGLTEQSEKHGHLHYLHHWVHEKLHRNTGNGSNTKLVI
jgi:hypothetical protein